MADSSKKRKQDQVRGTIKQLKAWDAFSIGERFTICVALLRLAFGRYVPESEIGEMLEAISSEDLEPGQVGAKYLPSKIWRAQNEAIVRYRDCIYMSILLKRNGMAVDPGWIAFGDATTAEAPSQSLIDEARNKFPAIRYGI